MRLIARGRVIHFYHRHPASRVALETWYHRIKAGHWTTMAQIQAAFPKAKVLNADRIRFEISGGDFRLIAAIDFGRSIVFVKFIGTHAEYDKIDALRVSLF